jgi:hypothetical protein
MSEGLRTFAFLARCRPREVACPTPLLLHHTGDATKMTSTFDEPPKMFWFFRRICGSLEPRREGFARRFWRHGRTKANREEKKCPAEGHPAGEADVLWFGYARAGCSSAEPASISPFHRTSSVHQLNKGVDPGVFWGAA